MFGRIHHTVIESRVLKQNPLGDSARRDVYLYLPPTYDQDLARRFPVVYLLTGFTGRGRQMLNDNSFAPSLPERFAQMIGAGKAREMILVMPDFLTRLGGSQYINSTAIGNYETHFIEELVPFVDENFRTLPDRESRAVAGKSSGGYAALIYAMRHAETFALAAAHSGDACFEYCFTPDFPKTFRTLKKHGGVRGFLDYFWRTEDKAQDDVPTLNIVAMSAAYSPHENRRREDASVTLEKQHDANQNSSDFFAATSNYVTPPDFTDVPLDFDLPFDLDIGELRQDVFNRWLAHDPTRIIENHLDNLRSMKLLYFDAGVRDEFGLDIGANVLSAKLRQHNIKHLHEQHDGGHFNTSHRYARSLELISELIAN